MEIKVEAVPISILEKEKPKERKGEFEFLFAKPVSPLGGDPRSTTFLARSQMFASLSRVECERKNACCATGRNISRLKWYPTIRNIRWRDRRKEKVS